MMYGSYSIRYGEQGLKGRGGAGGFGGFDFSDDRVQGVDVTDLESGRHVRISTGAVINATGVWTDDVEELAGRAQALALKWGGDDVSPDDFRAEDLIGTE